MGGAGRADAPKNHRRVCEGCLCCLAVRNGLERAGTRLLWPAHQRTSPWQVVLTCRCPGRASQAGLVRAGRAANDRPLLGKAEGAISTVRPVTHTPHWLHAGAVWLEQSSMQRLPRATVAARQDPASGPLCVLLSSRPSLAVASRLRQIRGRSLPPKPSFPIKKPPQSFQSSGLCGGPPGCVGRGPPDPAAKQAFPVPNSVCACAELSSPPPVRIALPLPERGLPRRKHSRQLRRALHPRHRLCLIGPGPVTPLSTTVPPLTGARHVARQGKMGNWPPSHLSPPARPCMLTKKS
jgi:hypothetical protein